MRETREEKLQRANEIFCEASRHDDAHNYKQAFRLYLEAARLGDSGAQNNLASYYSSGTGVPKNLAEAEGWYKKAYKAGERCAANNLATNKRSAGNFRAAVLWFKRAMTLDDGDAAVELAKLYIGRNQTKLAIAALKQALTMTPSDLSEYGREEAEALLQQLTS